MNPARAREAPVACVRARASAQKDSPPGSAKHKQSILIHERVELWKVVRESTRKLPNMSMLASSVCLMRERYRARSLAHETSRVC